MTRYAIYFVPLDNADLWQFGCAAIGYDSSTGQVVLFHTHELYQRLEIKDWTADPRRYGFHATLKPPFILADGKSIEQLESAVAKFCASRKAFFIKRLEIEAIDNFIALVPPQTSHKLNQLAADCVTTFEMFRAPLSQVDRERRLKSPLTKSQIAYLDTWGYPYVFDEFKFHMTLTGRLPDTSKTQMLSTLRELYAPISKPVKIGSIAICEQTARNTHFKVRKSFEFGG